MTEQLPNTPARVRMTHPTLNDEITVDPLSVGHLEYAGWQVVKGQDVEYEQWPAELQRFEGQQQVRMHHPDLQNDIIVGKQSVGMHRSKGWLISDPEVAAQLDAERTGASGLEAKTVDELKELARTRDLPVSGTKAELIERLNEQDSQNEAGEQPAPTEEG